MLEVETIIFVKKNLTLLNYIVGIISFLFGVSPLFMEREKVEKQANVIYIEISAAIFLIFTISMFSLDFISNINLLKKNTCISLKKEYKKELPFKELYPYRKGKIIKVGDENYLVKNNKYLRELDIKEDYKYNIIKCSNL